jgi:hypothetical protein
MSATTPTPRRSRALISLLGAIHTGTAEWRYDQQPTRRPTRTCWCGSLARQGWTTCTDHQANGQARRGAT